MSDLRERLEHQIAQIIGRALRIRREETERGERVQQEPVTPNSVACEVLAALDQPELGEEERCGGSGYLPSTDPPPPGFSTPVPISVNCPGCPDCTGKHPDPPGGFERAVEAALIGWNSNLDATDEEGMCDALLAALPHLQPEQGVEQLQKRVEEQEAALRYILGEDVPGYEAHMRPTEVARAALNHPSEETSR